MTDKYISLDGGLKKLNHILEAMRTALEKVVENDRRKAEEVRQTIKDLKIKKEADEKAVKEYYAQLHNNKKDQR